MDFTFTFILLVMITGGSLVTGTEKRWREAYGCSGQRLELSCETDEVIWFVKTFYGVSARQPKVCSYTPGDCVSSNSEQANLFKEIGLGTTGFQSYGTDVASTQTCGGRADYRQDYYYCVKRTSIRSMCSQFTSTVKEGFLSTTNFPDWVPDTDKNCNCSLQPLGGDVTVQVVQFYYNQLKGESKNGVNITARWGSEWPNKINGVKDGGYMNYTLVHQTTERVHLQLLNEGISIGRLWLHFIGSGSVRVTCGTGIPPPAPGTTSPTPTTKPTTASTPVPPASQTTKATTASTPVPPAAQTTPSISSQSTSTSPAGATQANQGGPEDDMAYIIGGAVGGAVLVIIIIIIVVTLVILKRKNNARNNRSDFDYDIVTSRNPILAKLRKARSKHPKSEDKNRINDTTYSTVPPAFNIAAHVNQALQRDKTMDVDETADNVDDGFHSLPRILDRAEPEYSNFGVPPPVLYDEPHHQGRPTGRSDGHYYSPPALDGAVEGYDNVAHHYATPDKTKGQPAGGKKQKRTAEKSRSQYYEPPPPEAVEKDVKGPKVENKLLNHKGMDVSHLYSQPNLVKKRSKKAQKKAAEKEVEEDISKENMMSVKYAKPNKGKKKGAEAKGKLANPPTPKKPTVYPKPGAAIDKDDKRPKSPQPQTSPPPLAKSPKPLPKSPKIHRQGSSHIRANSPLLKPPITHPKPKGAEGNWSSPATPEPYHPPAKKAPKPLPKPSNIPDMPSKPSTPEPYRPTHAPPQLPSKSGSMRNKPVGTRSRPSTPEPYRPSDAPPRPPSRPGSPLNTPVDIHSNQSTPESPPKSTPPLPPTLPDPKRLSRHGGPIKQRYSTRITRRDGTEAPRKPRSFPDYDDVTLNNSDNNNVEDDTPVMIYNDIYVSSEEARF